MRNERCPVCGYNEMPYAPVPENICPCCGTEFGFDDYYHTRDQLRQMWIRANFPWFDDIIRPPKNWSPALQLIKAGLGADLISASGEKIGSRQTEVRITFEPLRLREQPTETDMARGIGYAHVTGVLTV